MDKLKGYSYVEAVGIVAWYLGYTQALLAYIEDRNGETTSAAARKYAWENVTRVLPIEVGGGPLESTRKVIEIMRQESEQKLRDAFAAALKK